MGHKLASQLFVSHYSKVIGNWSMDQFHIKECSLLYARDPITEQMTDLFPSVFDDDVAKTYMEDPGKRRAAGQQIKAIRGKPSHHRSRRHQSRQRAARRTKRKMRGS